MSFLASQIDFKRRVGPIVRSQSGGRQAPALQLRVVCATILLLITGCYQTAPPLLKASSADRARADEYAEELHAAIWNRLALMPAVAQSKFHQQRPISDRAREAELVEQFRKLAMNRGIHPEFAERVIRAQIDASKRVQTELYEEWKAHPPPEDTHLRDLVQDLRPAIDVTNERMLVALQLLGAVPDELKRAMEHAHARRSPLPPHVSGEAWDVAWGPLLAIPENFMPGREALGPIPTLRSAQPENQPFVPDFAPEEETATVPAEEADATR